MIAIIKTPFDNAQNPVRPSILEIQEFYYDEDYSALCLDTFDNSYLCYMTPETYIYTVNQMTEQLLKNAGVAVLDLSDVGVFLCLPDELMTESLGSEQYQRFHDKFTVELKASSFGQN